MPIIGSDDPLGTAWSGLKDSLSYIGDQAGRLRYGMPTSEKEAMAKAASLPGAPGAGVSGMTEIPGEDRLTRARRMAAMPVPNDEQDNRYASGYLFAKTYPNAAPVIQPIIDQVKTSSLPFFGGDSPEVQSYARAGMNRAVADAQSADAEEARSRALARMVASR